MFKNFLLFFFFSFLFSSEALAQYIPISQDAEISIITIGPGAQLYDKFGHSAVRVYDAINGYDIVYNYGTYDWNTPNFYTKFVQGKLLYQLTTSYFQPFIARYKQENRWVKQQVLNLSTEEKTQFFNFLQNNAKEENRDYKYDFFFDNCATRIRDGLVEHIDNEIEFGTQHAETEKTFRGLIQENVHWNTWSSLGMDVAIGAVTDRKATAWEYQYLPDYLFEAVAQGEIKDGNTPRPLVTITSTLFQNTPTDVKPSFFTSPFFIFSLIALLVLWVTYRDFKNETRSRLLDTVIFVLTSVTGIILAMLWFATDHTATVNNYNLLWAFPFSIFVVVAISKKNPKAWVRRFVFFLLLLFALLTIHWITGVQVFALGFLPLFIALAVRYIYVVYYLGNIGVTANK